jgi:hypothetical protein
MFSYRLSARTSALPNATWTSRGWSTSNKIVTADATILYLILLHENVATPTRDRNIKLLPGTGGSAGSGIAGGALLVTLAAAALIGGSMLVLVTVRTLRR